MKSVLSRELTLREIPFRRQVPLPIVYKGVQLDCGYRIDLLIAEQVVVEIKAVSDIETIHEAQLLTYLKLGGWKIGLLINFNVTLLKTGIRRRVLGLEEAIPKPLRSLRLSGEISGKHTCRHTKTQVLISKRAAARWR